MRQFHNRLLPCQFSHNVYANNYATTMYKYSGIEKVVSIEKNRNRGQRSQEPEVRSQESEDRSKNLRSEEPERKKLSEKDEGDYGTQVSSG